MSVPAESHTLSWNKVAVTHSVICQSPAESCTVSGTKLRKRTKVAQEETIGGDNARRSVHPMAPLLELLSIKIPLVKLKYSAFQVSLSPPGKINQELP